MAPFLNSPVELEDLEASAGHQSVCLRPDDERGEAIDLLPLDVSIYNYRREAARENPKEAWRFERSRRIVVPCASSDWLRSF